SPLLLQEFQAIHTGHPQVEQNDARGFGPVEVIEGFPPVRGTADAKPFFFKQVRQSEALLAVVIHQKNMQSNAHWSPPWPLLETVSQGGCRVGLCPFSLKDLALSCWSSTFQFSLFGTTSAHFQPRSTDPPLGGQNT